MDGTFPGVDFDLDLAWSSQQKISKRRSIGTDRRSTCADATKLRATSIAAGKQSMLLGS